MALRVKASPIPSNEDVDASVVGAASSVQFRRQAQALNQAAGVVGGRRIVTASTYVSSTDTHLLVDATSGARTIRFFRCSEYPTNKVTVERYLGANTVTVTPRGSDTIDGAASLVVTKPVILGPINNSKIHVFSTGA